MNWPAAPAAETVSHRFEFIVVTPPGLADPGLAIAASRAGALGVLDLQFVRDVDRAVGAIRRLARHARNPCGIKLDSTSWPQYAEVRAALPAAVSVAILSAIDRHHLSERVRALRDRRLTVLLEVISDDEARAGEEAGVDGLIAKGHESGGRVGEDTTFVMLQRLLGTTRLPVWAQGGIGLHTAAGCLAAGAAGIVLDSQLALTRESGLPREIKDAIARLDGSETVCVGSELGECIRVVAPPGSGALAELQQLAAGHEARGLDVETRREWWRQIGARIGWDAPERQVWPIGQETTLPARGTRRFDRVARVLEDFRDAVVAAVGAAKKLKPLDEGAPLAKAHGTRYPIVQGPMTRVSDRAEFAARVAEGGALPFLALALMRAPDVARLLDDTRAALGDRPWGVGILGFVPDDLRAEQLEVVRAHKPSMALIAGGHPHQAAALERAGIPTYLHVPSPGLLELFIETGTRRFVFEGRECGGHVGPRGSFALWDACVETLLKEIPPADMPNCHVLFAGGIHDARSASMVAAVGAPLAERGAKIGVLLGTAYLFTREAVESGAIVEGFQREAVRCRRTVLLNSGPGHLTRCAATPYAELFEHERRRLIGEGRSAEEVRTALEALNLGRLRIAAKGLKREDDHRGTSPRLVPANDIEQHADGMYMIGQLAALEDSTRTIADLHEDVSRGSSNLLDRAPSVPAGRAAVPHTPRPFDVAIVGMSCLLPKAPDLRTYWDNILHRVDAITEVPSHRWDWRAYFDPDPAAPDKVNSKWGGFLDPIRFDPARYGMPPHSCASIEPLQLLTLEAVREALADAGSLDRDLPRDRTAVILGVSGGIADLGQQYAVRSALPTLCDPVPPEWLSKLATWSEDSFPGILPNVAAGRVANRFDLSGVNYTVDAACASSLAAVYLACCELEAGTSEVVIAGGADTIQNPFAYLCFAKTHALSPHGRCATFDQRADGIAISEGVAILVLKRLADAERDGDRIYAVIKGVAGSSDGRDKGLTAPRPEGQVLALERAYTKAGVSPATVGLVEAHGTGTVAGDEAELETLNRVFGGAGAGSESCAIGSVKSMIGHTKSTAGVAGLMKVALALHHKVLPPTIHVSTPNPGAQRPGSPLYVNTETRPWVHADTGRPRRASVSAFGFGGTNFHAVLEEYAGSYLGAEQEASRQSWPSELMIWRGEARRDIQVALARMDVALSNGFRADLRDLSYSTWHAARARTGVTLAMVVSSFDELRDKVKRAARALEDPIGHTDLASRRIWFTETPLARGGRTAVLFPGQGSQYPGMLNELATYFGTVREPFERATRVLAARFAQPLATYVFPPPRFSANERQADMHALTATSVAQPALGAAGVALYRLLDSCAVRPDMVGGHSYGEYVALCVAGAFDEDTLYVLSEARGRCIAENSASEPGAMAGAAADRERTMQLIHGIDGVWVANINAPSQTVISGRRDAVDAAVERLGRAGVAARQLPVACAFHSPLMTPARDQLTTIIQNTALATPHLPVFSNVSADAYPQHVAAMTQLLSEQLVRPVRFAEQIQAMYDAGARLFIEAGPAQVLSGLVTQILDSAPHLALPLDVRERSGLSQFQHALAQLAAHGVAVSLDPLFAGRGARLVDLDRFEGADEPTTSTSWLVSGGHAMAMHPASGAPAAQREHQATASTRTPIDYQASRAQMPTATPLPSVPTPPARERADDASRAVLQFQQLMTTFLETQKQVMLAYLAGRSDGSVLELPRMPQATDRSVPAETLAPTSARSSPPTPSAPEAEPAIVAHPPDDNDLTSRLVSIVSQRTGYPSELLGLDLNVEAELGIDSIKRVEIVGEFGRQLQRSHGVELQQVIAQLAAAKTLRAIADGASALITALPPSARPAPESAPFEVRLRADAVAPREIPRFVLDIQDAPLPAACECVGPGDLVVITDDGRGIAERVAARIRARGASVALMGARADGALEVIRAQHARPVSGILHLSPLGYSKTRTTIDVEPGAENVRTLLHLVHAAAEDLKRVGTRRGGWVIAATAMGGAFGTRSGRSEWVFGHGAIAGFMKTLAIEWPQVRCKVVDLETAPPSVIAEQILAEILCETDFVEVGFDGSRRVTVRPVPDALDRDESAAPAVESDSVLLVTGGARGVTAAIAIDVARQYRPTLVIVGRTPMATDDEQPHLAGLASEHELKSALLAEAKRTGEPVSARAVESAYTAIARQREVRSNLDAMRRLGARVDYRQVDVIDDHAFAAVIEDVYRTYGRVDGVIHGAGVIEDTLLEHKTAESFARVFDTKVRSALTLVRHLRGPSLRFLAFFSSVAGCFGNRGQIDYAAANETLNKLALHLNHEWPGRIVSLNWGPWSSNGMASGAVRQQFIERGISPIDVEAGCLAFDRELRCGRKGHVEVVLGDGPWADAPAAAVCGPIERIERSAV